MESRPPSPTQSSPLGHSIGEAVLSQTLPHLTPKVKIGNHHWHVVKMVGGRQEAPVTNPGELQKAAEIGAVLIKSHNRSVQGTPLQGRKVTVMEQRGVHYQDGSFVAHGSVHLNAQERSDYLAARNDKDWHQHVKSYEAHLGTLAPTTQVPHATLPPSIAEYIRRNPRLIQASYTPNELKQILLSFTKEKILATHDIFATTQTEEPADSYRGMIKAYVDQETSPSALIDKSNRTLEQHLTAEHVWNAMLQVLQPAEYRFYRAEEAEEDPFDPSFGARSSSPLLSPSHHSSSRPSSVPLTSHGSSSLLDRQDPLASSREELGLPALAEELNLDAESVLHPHPRPRSLPSLHQHDAVHRPLQYHPLMEDHELASSRSPSPRRTESPTSHLHSQEDRVGFRSLSSSPLSSSRGASQTILKPTPLRLRPASVKDHDLTSSRTPSPGPSDPGRVVQFQHGGETTSAFSAFSSARSFEEPKGKSSQRSPIPRSARFRSVEMRPVRHQRELTYLDRPDFRAKGALYPGLALRAKNSDPYRWASKAESQALCQAALEKIGRSAVDELTTQELNVVKRVIELREKVGGFGSLVNGDCYRAVEEDLERYAKAGLRS